MKANLESLLDATAYLCIVRRRHVVPDGALMLIRPTTATRMILRIRFRTRRPGKSPPGN
ncbi:hypothetical protein KCP74_10015 [Salmonella enterica subsp. enterica]|nr:hypothetical protein KCP74_10015 [Salmonella enterica subsp. enterica]